jgi:hypothetical protein
MDFFHQDKRFSVPKTFWIMIFLNRLTLNFIKKRLEK